MSLVLKDGSIFLHVPKTGGNWVTTVLDKCGLIAESIGEHKHIDMTQVISIANNSEASMASRIKQRIGLSKEKPYMFCFVRDPITWYESWFEYMSQPTRNWCNWGDEKSMDSWHLNSILNGLGDSDFNQFVRNVINKRPGYVTELFGWYTTPQIDFIGKQENLVNDLISILNHLNLDFDENMIRSTGKIGVSKKPVNKIEWNAELYQEVYKLEYAGMIRYGYAEKPPIYK